MKRFTLLFALAAALAVNAFSQQIIWNYQTTMPYGPPTYAGVTRGSETLALNTLYVNRVDLLVSPTFQISKATFNTLTTGTSVSMTFCYYGDRTNPPLASGSAQVTQTGPQSISYSAFTPPQTLYIAYVFEGTKAPVLESFFTGQFPAVQAIFNFNSIRWGTSPNYVTGQGCPASLGTLAAIVPTLNLPMIASE
jgi:hypothetical protein